MAEGARDTGEVRDAETARNVSGAFEAFATLPELPERTQRRAEALARWLAPWTAASARLW